MINLFLEERSLMVERSVGAQLPMLMFSCLQLLLLQWFFPFTASREGWLGLLRGVALIACVSVLRGSASLVFDRTCLKRFTFQVSHPFQGHPSLGCRPLPSLRAFFWGSESRGASRTLGRMLIGVGP